MNKNVIEYVKECYIYNHEIYNGYLILFFEVNFNNEFLLLEKSIFIGSTEFNKLKTELRIGDTDQYDDLDKLDGVGVLLDIIRLENGTHAIGQITLDEEYWEYCQKERQAK